MWLKLVAAAECRIEYRGLREGVTDKVMRGSEQPSCMARAVTELPQGASYLRSLATSTPPLRMVGAKGTF